MRLLITALISLLLSCSVAGAASTVNPNVPGPRDPLNSAAVRNNFAAAAADINNILGCYAKSTPPTGPVNLQTWCDTSASPVYSIKIWNAQTTAWIPVASLNINTGVYTPVVVPGVYAATAPVALSVSGGVVTYSFRIDSNFAVVGNNLAFASISGGHLLANCSGGSAAPGNCSWSALADSAIGSSVGMIPYRTGGGWGTISTGTSGATVPLNSTANTFSAAQAIITNTTSLPAASSGALLSMGNVDGTPTRIELTSAGSNSVVTGRSSLGTMSAPLTLVNNSLMMSFNAHGYDGSAWATAANGAFRIYADGTWTGSSHPTRVCVSTTAASSTTINDTLCVRSAGGVTLGAASDQGAGTLNIPGLLYNNGVPPTGSGGGYVLANAPTITLNNATGLPLGTGVTGALATTNGGTGVTSFAAGRPLIGAGTAPIGLGTLTGNTSLFATGSGSYTPTNCIQTDASHNLVDAGVPCGTGLGVAGAQDFVAGVDFTAGVTMSLTTSSVPVNAASSSVSFDGVVQAHNTWTLSGSTFTFSAAIPANVQVVDIAWNSTTTLPTWVTSLGGVSGAISLAGGLSMSGSVLSNANIVYASDFMGTKTCDGSTNVTTELQTFLTRVSTNAATRGAVTGYFPPGDCRISAQLVMTINSSALAQNYRLIGYGTTITPDPSLAIGGLYIKRGTFLTYGDEQRSTLVEGLTCNIFNNANAVSCYEIDDRNVTFFRTGVMGGDQGVIHNAGAIGYYWHQSDPNDPNTGPFWGRMIDNFAQGQGPGLSSLPNAVVLQGSVNRFWASGNVLGGGTYGFTLINPCNANTNACGYIADGVVIENNDFGGFQSGIRITTTVPTQSTLAGLRIVKNTVESMVQSFVEASNIVLDSQVPNTLGPNTFINQLGAVYLNNGATLWSMMDEFTAKLTVDPPSLGAGATAVIGTASSGGVNTGMLCTVAPSADLLGVNPTCGVTAPGVVTFRNTNPTSAGIDLLSRTYIARVTYAY